MYRGQCQKFPKGYKFIVAVKRTEFIFPLQVPGDNSSTLMEHSQTFVSFLSFPSFPYTTVLQYKGQGETGGREGKGKQLVPSPFMILNSKVDSL